MAFFAGIRDTNDWGTGERPQSYRGIILRLNPNGKMPLFALTERLGSEKVDDPQYHWYNERNTVIQLALTATALTTSQTLSVASGGLQLRPSQVIKVNVIGASEPAVYSPANVEHMYLSSVTSDTIIVVKRGQFGTTPVALTTGTTHLTALGTAFGENSLPPAAVSNNPTKYTNYTEIFRTNFGLSRTADQTHARTGSAYKNDRERALFAHGRNIEFQFLFGLASEGTDASGYPLRTTGGLRSFITSNVTIFATSPTEDTFLNATYPVWNWDTRAGDERLCFCGNGFINNLNKLARTSNSTRVVQTEVIKMYGMNLNTWQLPQGKLAFKTHPLMNAHTQYNNSAFILDPTALRYRYMQDTIFMKNQQTPGQDGKLDGWLTECGLEVLAEETCAYIGNFVI